VIDRTLSLLRRQLEQKRHTAQVRIPDDLPLIFGDEERLAQVFSNLLENAIKYTPDRGTITITAEAGHDFVVIHVEDTGIGIPLNDLPRIFERFYRVDKARSREMGGTGLGLSIVKHLVEGHGGTVTVESLPGRGTKFRIMLPVAPASALPGQPSVRL
jgi:two-component system phosphate regulon sensor histidine kinase PhoR